MMEHLVNAVRTIVPLPEEEAEKLCGIGDTLSLSKGDVWIKEGQVPKHFALVIKGVLRIFYSDKTGNYFTKGFFQEGSFLSAYIAMREGKSSFFNIEVLEDAELIIIDYQKWLKLYEESAIWKDFLIALLTKGYSKKEKREREFLQLSAEERYSIFLSDYPGLDKRIKQHYIASYLGITPVALSRIRKKMGLLT